MLNGITPDQFTVATIGHGIEHDVNIADIKSIKNRKEGKKMQETLKLPQQKRKQKLCPKY
ncbi:hypothetical protein VRU48_05695 [Pedobacter sp. KR3-3]|uniref:Uncharacterized protein n=1 Tax=Pedobacter albus TaxID=3113905 RepID=A0ABU7I5J8_9SPHI|nr:hypothetical protein [Pedobacter sp. KR3-3]MEE1944591.1 hypothetical protein [Pedobacter sp. KR3-3]